MPTDELYKEMQKLLEAAPKLLAKYRQRLWKESQSALKNLQFLVPKKTP